jgi:hypothetical protein
MLSGILRWSNLAVLVWWAGSFVAFVLYGQAFVAHPTVWVPLLCTAAGWFFVILIHEIGHAGASIACGWRVLAFAVKPVGLHLPTRTITLLPRSHMSDAGGYVASVPKSRAQGTVLRKAIIVASGPVACLALAAAALLLRQFWLRALDTQFLIQSNFGTAVAIQACLSAFMSLLPYENSDGAQLLALLRRTPEWEAQRPYGWARGMLDYNVRLRDLPTWLVVAQGELPFPERKRYLAGLEIGRVLDADQPNYPRARRMIDAYRARYGGGAWLDSCDAYLAAVGEGDAEGAAARLWKGEPDPGLMAMQHAASASVLAVQGDAVGMKRELAAMRRANRAMSPYRNATFRDIERRIRAALRPA